MSARPLCLTANTYNMNELVKQIQSFAYRNGKDNKQVLSDLLRYIVGYFNPEPQPDTAWHYTKEQNAEFFAMLQQYLAIMNKELRTKEWYDAWGDLFMELTPRGGAKGQFFTPVDICNLMAESSIDTGMKPSSLCGAFGRRVTINDPAAGSARNLLAAHAMFIRDGKRPPYLIAEDVDIDCCRMSAVNLMVHGCFGEVICHNTLSEPKSLSVGFIINEGLYPAGAIPTIRIRHEPERFFSLR